MIDLDDDEGHGIIPDWDEWMALSEAEQDAIGQQVQAEHARWYDSLTYIERYEHHRQQNLKLCRDNRRRLRDPAYLAIPCIHEMTQEHLRSSQVRLMKIRAWRASGYTASINTQ